MKFVYTEHYLLRKLVPRQGLMWGDVNTVGGGGTLVADNGCRTSVWFIDIGDKVLRYLNKEESYKMK